MAKFTEDQPKLTLEGALQVMAGAEHRATEIGVPMNIAIVDDGGHMNAKFHPFAAFWYTAGIAPAARGVSCAAPPCRGTTRRFAGPIGQ